MVDALGEPIRPENYSDRFRRLSRAAGVPAIRLHRVRHSLADLLLRAGVLPSDGAELLGHTVEVFLSTYVPRAGKAGAARAAKALGGVLAEVGADHVDRASGSGAVTAALVAV